MGVSGLIAAFVCTVAAEVQDPASTALELARAGRYVEALDVAGHVPEAGLAARIEADVRWRAGDLDGALAAVREGVAASPDDALLRHTGARLALQLQRSRLAEAHVTALRDAVAAPAFQATLDSSGRGWWDNEIDALTGEVSRARQALDARDSAVSKARIVVGFAALTGLLAALGLLRRPKVRT